MPEHNVTQIALVANGKNNSTCKWQIAVSGDPQHQLAQETGECAICEVRIMSIPNGVRESHLLKQKLYREEYLITRDSPLIIKGMLSVNTPLSLEFSNGVQVTGMLSCRVNKRAVKSFNTSDIEQPIFPSTSEKPAISKETLAFPEDNVLSKSIDEGKSIGEMVIDEVLRMDNKEQQPIQRVEKVVPVYIPLQEEINKALVEERIEPPVGLSTSNGNDSLANTNQIQKILLIALSFLVFLCVVVLLLLTYRLLMLEGQIQEVIEVDQKEEVESLSFEGEE